MKYRCTFCAKLFVKAYLAQKFCSLLCANRFNLNNKNKHVRFPPINNNLAELFGILFGDGSVTKYFVAIYLNAVADKDYALYVFDLCKKLFVGANITSRYDSKDHTQDIKIYSKAVCDFLRGKGFNPQKRTVPKWILVNENFRKRCIRGLFDTEGSVGVKYFKGKRGQYIYKQLTFTNTNKNLLAFVETSLKRLGYRPTGQPSKNIYISNKAHISLFLKEIGTSNPKIARKAINDL